MQPSISAGRKAGVFLLVTLYRETLCIIAGKFNAGEGGWEGMEQGRGYMNLARRGTGSAALACTIPYSPYPLVAARAYPGAMGQMSSRLLAAMIPPDSTMII